MAKLSIMCKLLLIVAMTFILGCTSHLQNVQLERVAKDWCLTIRASQVIPVYPLTEDLQPGDVFLVQTPIADQVRVYRKKGFLPLENILVRLKPDTYESFYSSRYGIVNGNVPPKQWQFPVANERSPDFTIAPLAAFPSYSFSVSRKGGLNVAIPVQGIPIGLNMMGSGEAHGSVSIVDSHTYGIDMQRMWELINSWAEDEGNREFLKQFAPQSPEDKNGDRHYLRVVNRVFLTGKVNIALFNDEDFVGEVSGGVPKPVGLLSFANYSSGAMAFERINSLLSSQQGGQSAGVVNTATGIAPGGTLQLAMASSRSVSLVETFARPLVFGYIAFDLPILVDGRLGPPVSTAAQLDGINVLPGHDIPFKYEPDMNSKSIRSWLFKDRKSNYPLLEEWLKQKNMTRKDIPKILDSYDYRDLRSEIVEQFGL
jgi:hypothetical protein